MRSTGEMTALACALYHNLCPDTEKNAVAANLNERVVQNHYLPDFGISGTKMVARVLADYGYADSAYKLITQDGYPGYVHWFKQGATTLWGNWDGNGSRNHIMFDDMHG